MTSQHIPSILAEPPSAAALQRYALEMYDLYHRAPCGYHSLNEDGYYLRINATEEELLGYSHRELIGKCRFMDLLTPESQDIFLFGFSQLLSGGSLHDLELMMQRKDGHTVPVLLNSTASMSTDGCFVMCRSSLHDISNQWRYRQELLESREQLRELSSHLQTVREEEKRAIARELHDELGCILSALRLDISRMQKKPPTDSTGFQSITSEMLAMLDEAVQTTRRLVSQLNPTILDDMGLIAALNWQLREFSRRSGLEHRVEILGEQLELDKTCNLTLFRVLQEALTNIARHAQASRVDVSLIFEDEALIMEISDNGIGIDPDIPRNPASHGIRGMDERMRMIGGLFSVLRHPLKGTLLRVSIPTGASS